jgi:hypothetical protein
MAVNTNKFYPGATGWLPLQSTVPGIDKNANNLLINAALKTYPNDLMNDRLTFTFINNYYIVLQKKEFFLFLSFTS